MYVSMCGSDSLLNGRVELFLIQIAHFDQMPNMKRKGVKDCL